jgi:hypothetical protein
MLEAVINSLKVLVYNLGRNYRPRENFGISDEEMDSLFSALDLLEAIKERQAILRR